MYDGLRAIYGVSERQGGPRSSPPDARDGPEPAVRKTYLPARMLAAPDPSLHGGTPLGIRTEV